MCREGYLGEELEVVCRGFLYSSYTHPIFILYRSYINPSELVVDSIQNRGCLIDTGSLRSFIIPALFAQELLSFLYYNTSIVMIYGAT